MQTLILNWVTQLKVDVPGVAVLVGVHSDTDRRHAHALIFIPRRITDPHHPPGISVVGSSWEAWLNWPPPRPARRWRRRHGRLRVHTQPTWGHEVWVQPYDATLLAEAGKHGAAEYLARDPGSVMSFGTAPLRK